MILPLFTKNMYHTYRAMIEWTGVQIDRIIAISTKNKETTAIGQQPKHPDSKIMYVIANKNERESIYKWKSHSMLSGIAAQDSSWLCSSNKFVQRHPFTHFNSFAIQLFTRFAPFFYLSSSFRCLSNSEQMKHFHRRIRSQCNCESYWTWASVHCILSVSWLQMAKNRFISFTPQPSPFSTDY